MTIDQVDRYCDAVPRRSGRAEQLGGLTLFVREDGGAPYYARPTVGGTERPTAEQVRAALARQGQLGVPEAFEWLEETAPELAALLEAEGLTVARHPLLALDTAADMGALASAVPAARRNDVRLLGPDDPAVPSAVAAQYLGFGTPGTALGGDSLPELAKEVEAREADGTVARLRDRLRSGATVLAAALDGRTAVGAGQHNPVDGVTEIVGVATLPAYRRRGLGLAVTAALVDHARIAGASTVFLSAEDADVARLYGRLGFRHIGTALTAER